MPFIGKQPQAGAYSKLDAITTSATATYNLTLDSGAYYPQSANHLLVSLNGVIQAPQDSFTVSGSQIIFDSALTSADVIDFIIALGDTLDIGVPSAGSVNTSQLANGAVTSAKLDTNIAVTGTLSSGSSMTATGELKANGGVVFNEDSLDVDFRVESNGNANMLVVDGGNDRVGIGTASPQQLVDIAHSGSQVAGAIRIGDPSSISTNTGIYMRTTGLATIGAAGGTIVFDTNFGSSEKVRIDSDGLKFNGDTAAANALDDYEEGTWTPTFQLTAGSLSGQSLSGTYVKIGRQVTLTLYASAGTSSSASFGGFAGLPFTSENVNQKGSGIFRESAVSGHAYEWVVNSNAATSVVRRYDNNSSISTSMVFVGSMTYFTA